MTETPSDVLTVGAEATDVVSERLNHTTHHTEQQQTLLPADNFGRLRSLTSRFHSFDDPVQ